MSETRSLTLPMLLVFGLLLLLTTTNGRDTPDQVTTAPRFMVLIVEETSARTPGLAALLLSEEMRSKVAALGHAFRLVDKDATEWDGTPAAVLGPWRALPALPGGQSRVLPWVLFVSSDGRVLFEGPLPGSVDAVVDLVTKHTSRA
jgi:hypothetical protein